MKKTNLKKYILEALGALLVIAAVAGVHMVSSKEAMANENVNLKLVLGGTTKVYYSDKSGEYEDKASEISSYDIQVKKKNATEVLATDTVTVGTEKEIAFSSAEDGDYTLSIVGCTFNDGTEFESCTNTADAAMSSKSVVFTINNMEIVTKTVAPLPTVKLTLNTSGTTKVYYSDKSGEYENKASEISSYDIQVKKKNATEVLATDTVTVGTEKEIAFSSAEDGDYTLSIVGCTFNDGTKFESCTNTADAAMSSKSVVFTINNMEIVTKTVAPLPTVKLTLNTSGTTTVYYSGRSIVYEGEASKIQNYKVQVVKKDATEVLAVDTVTVGTEKEITFSSAEDGDYTLSIVGCTFTDGTIFKSCSNTADGNMNSKSIVFTIENLSIETTTSAVDKATIHEGELAKKNSSFSIDLDTALTKKILAAQTGENKTKIDYAIATNVPLILKLSIKDSGVKDSEKEKMEKKAESKSSDARIGDTFQLTLALYNYNNDNLICDITDTGGNDIEITYTLSDDIKTSSSSSSKSSTRYYRVYFVHNDSADDASGWQKAKSGKITFNATKFSPYGVAYYDESSSSSSSSSSVAASNSASVRNTIDTTSGNAGSGKSPKTGDNFNPRIWIYLLIVAATIATCAGVLLHDTKDTDEAERK